LQIICLRFMTLCQKRSAVEANFGTTALVALQMSGLQNMAFLIIQSQEPLRLFLRRKIGFKMSLWRSEFSMQ